MAIRARYTKSDISKKLKGDVGRIESAIMAILSREGEQFVTDARDSLSINRSAFPKGNYTDRTTNLRNSIGYFILFNNQVVRESFPGAHKAKATDVLKELTPRMGYKLVGVVGEEYGTYVESKGFNVITSQSFMIMDRLNDQLKKLRKKRNIDAESNFNFSSQLS